MVSLRSFYCTVGHSFAKCGPPLKFFDRHTQQSVCNSHHKSYSHTHKHVAMLFCEMFATFVDDRASGLAFGTPVQSRCNIMLFVSLQLEETRSSWSWRLQGQKHTTRPSISWLYSVHAHRQHCRQSDSQSKKHCDDVEHVPFCSRPS